jgi:hypothetical protein
VGGVFLFFKKGKWAGQGGNRGLHVAAALLFGRRRRSAQAASGLCGRGTTPPRRRVCAPPSSLLRWCAPKGAALTGSNLEMGKEFFL